MCFTAHSFVFQTRISIQDNEGQQS